VKIGVDMVEIGRVARMVEKSPAFSRRTFSSTELGVAGRLPAKRREEYLAGRFAVKEAALKALGVGLSRNLRLTEIETVSLSSGAPRLALRGKVSELAKHDGVRELHVSISHERGFAVAFVILASGGKAVAPRWTRAFRNRATAQGFGGKQRSVKKTSRRG
jgi:holo-[acyl-carrier protein] synthase